MRFGGISQRLGSCPIRPIRATRVYRRGFGVCNASLYLSFFLSVSLKGLRFDVQTEWHTLRPQARPKKPRCTNKTLNHFGRREIPSTTWMSNWQLTQVRLIESSRTITQKNETAHPHHDQYRRHRNCPPRTPASSDRPIDGKAYRSNGPERGEGRPDRRFTRVEAFGGPGSRMRICVDGEKHSAKWVVRSRLVWRLHRQSIGQIILGEPARPRHADQCHHKSRAVAPHTMDGDPSFASSRSGDTPRNGQDCGFIGMLRVGLDRPAGTLTTAIYASRDEAEAARVMDVCG